MSTAVEKRMLSLEEIEAQTALVLPERELMHHHKHHHQQQHQTFLLVCFNNHFNQHFPNHNMNGGQWGNNQSWGNNFNHNNQFNNRFNEGCQLIPEGQGLNSFGPDPSLGFDSGF